VPQNANSNRNTKNIAGAYVGRRNHVVATSVVSSRRPESMVSPRDCDGSRKIHRCNTYSASAVSCFRRRVVRLLRSSTRGGRSRVSLRRVPPALSFASFPGERQRRNREARSRGDALGDDAGRQRRGFVVISRESFDSLFDSYFF